jgi:hypothetical protein
MLLVFCHTGVIVSGMSYSTLSSRWPEPRWSVVIGADVEGEMLFPGELTAPMETSYYGC